MQFNIELDTSEKFKKFWETIAEREGYYFSDLLSEFNLGELTYDKELDYEDEDGNDNIAVWNDEIDPEYLTHYYFSMDDSWDRVGDVRVRMFIPMINPISMNQLLNELPELEARRKPIAKKYDIAFNKKQLDMIPTESEMEEMKDIENELYLTFGVGIGLHYD